MKDDGILFHLMGHVYNKQTLEVFKQPCLIDRAEFFQSTGCDFNSENVEIFHVSSRLNFDEFVIE